MGSYDIFMYVSCFAHTCPPNVTHWTSSISSPVLLFLCLLYVLLFVFMYMLLSLGSAHGGKLTLSFLYCFFTHLSLPSDPCFLRPLCVRGDVWLCI